MSTTNTTQTSLYRNRHERGRTRIDWLDSYHTFSFGDYYDPRFMGFSDLRVINDDRVGPGGGFPTHGHRDMEIVTVVLKGELEHQDSMGNGSIIRPGEIQRMTAGTGVRHSEFNPSSSETVHLLQIWMLPERKGLEPGYEQKSFSPEKSRGQFQLIATRNPGPDAVLIHQDAAIYTALLENSQQTGFPLQAERSYWLHVATGAVEIDGQILEEGDALAFTGTAANLRIEAQAPGTAANLRIEAQAPGTQLLLFDLKP